MLIFMFTLLSRSSKPIIPIIHRNRHIHNTLCARWSNTKESITIGDVTRIIEKAEHPELVPQKYVSYADDGTIQLSQTALYHLRWMLQKDLLGQDIFLIGEPGFLRRHLTMQYLELTNRELEYIALSRDTTESELKQRREIRNREAVYYDQCAVRAAVHGRVLVLDGVECAERNVLPILNNLLENREMHLENGKFLMAPERYDNLLKFYSKENLDSWGVLRVSEQFRVIALGCPSQKYKGTPLDPPLRSRFQSRYVTHFPFDEQLCEFKRSNPQVSIENLKCLLSFGLTIHGTDVFSNFPDFPIDNLRQIAWIMNCNPNLNVYEALMLLYPYKMFLKKNEQEHICTLLNTLNIPMARSKSVKKIVNEQLNPIGDYPTEISFKLDEVIIRILGGHKTLCSQKKTLFIDLEHQRNILALLIQAISVGDVCLLGIKGVGKLTLIKHLVHLLHQRMEPMILYEDMTSRDLVQQRITTMKGDTVWRDSPLVKAAKTGSVALLNGINHLHKSALCTLQRLIHDREMHLCDGSILLRSDRYESLLQQGFTRHELSERGILKIKDGFKIIALAEPPNCNSSSHNWLSSEILNMFLFLQVPPINKYEEYEIIRSIYGNIDKIGSGQLSKIINLSHKLRESTNPILQHLAPTLSTRQLLKIAKRMSNYPTDAYNILQNIFLIKFMPSLPKLALEITMKEIGIETTGIKKCEDHAMISINDNLLRIGNTEMIIVPASDQSKVPSTLFYEIPQHVALLENLLQDFLIGEHLLLIGNQGVGKNKIIDKLLQLMNKPREYLQLHRDTTVQSLTIQTVLRDGHVIYEDSALVKAVKNGHVLVIDEADKAPVNVTCILRTLIESGEMMLTDGRKIVSTDHHKEYLDENVEEIIKTHPDFRAIVLANRPGFPFLGNDFFSSLGDVFSCYAVDNPSPDSEIYLLQQYGPSVPKNILYILVNAFGELRQMADEGLLNYPYSTREVVNIVKHLEKYPNEDMSELIRNVLDFDRYHNEVLEQVTSILAKHGLPIEINIGNKLLNMHKKCEIQLTVNRVNGYDVSSPKYGKIDPKNQPHIGGNTWAGGTGGRDTAGLGGKGGPFRLDAGHTVHQISEEEKDGIPDENKQAARDMNRKIFAEKLREIRMSSHDYQLYAKFSEPIRKQVQQLKAILNAMETKSKERQWQKYQTYGELDDTRLIEGITGEKNIYRRRGEMNSWPDYGQQIVNRFKLVIDVSGSMYRFNGYDGRLDRELEAVVMVMEAFQSYEKRIVYDIIGHNGEGYEIPFVKSGNPPCNDKERFEITRLIFTHAQFCWPGDNTLKATEAALKTLTEEEYDNNVVVILSDANLARYHINPKTFAKILMKCEPKVKGYVIFIGSLAEEAKLISAQMPAGHSFLCMDISKLPQILKEIFSSSFL